MAELRLQRYLSQAGVASRRAAERLIVEGAVKVNGKVVSELGTKIDPEVDTVMVNGLRVMAQEHQYWLINKPKGTVTTVNDPEGRPTVMSLLPNEVAPGVVPVGRLDYYTEGVLLLTNDGELANGLLHPKGSIEKTYHVKLKGKCTPEELQRLRDGVRLDDGYVTMPADVDDIPMEQTKSVHHTWLQITIREGRTRQVHRMAEAIGKDVLKLARIGFAGLSYYGMRVGEARKLSDEEVQHLKDLAARAAEQEAPPRETRNKRAAARIAAERFEREQAEQRPRPRPARPPGPAAGPNPAASRPGGDRPMGDRPTGARPMSARPVGARARPPGPPAGPNPAASRGGSDRPTGDRPRAAPFDRPRPPAAGAGDRPQRSFDSRGGGKPSGERPQRPPQERSKHRPSDNRPAPRRQFDKKSGSDRAQARRGGGPPRQWGPGDNSKPDTRGARPDARGPRPDVRGPRPGGGPRPAGGRPSRGPIDRPRGRK